jgi:transcriptional regulator with XRE-family HTH domain
MTEKISFQIEFGKQVERLRTQKNLSYRQLAQRCDIDHSNLSKIEKGEINIRLSTIYELLKGLDVQPNKLFEFKINLNNG